ncbi:hypothetical protein NQ315_011802 [Exocentrus adspersus]|uniref:Breast cancer susceptibility 1 n=1 Tax=Exocentrus adspersus TaxID=1586481 RepID=A0AAV8W0I9_9CUCU|nr:hypothetical protein NQ315_011802 [Exocentrus adspersus]
MFSFDASQLDDTFLRPCACVDESKNISKSFCYVEGTDLDTTRSDTKEELSENVWFENKPPKLFIKGLNPLITARQIHVSRVVMNGARGNLEAAGGEAQKSGKAAVNMKKKRSAVKFLSTTEIVID